MSPEMIAGNISMDTNIGRKTDIWSIGCLMIEMIIGELPKFTKRDVNTGESVVLKGEAAVLCYVGNGGSPDIPDQLPTEIHAFIARCIQRKPGVRPTAADLLQDPFLTSENVASLIYLDNRPEVPLINSQS